MTAGDWVTLGVLALVVGAVLLGRRKGISAQLAARNEAYSAGFAAGHAEATATAHAAAVGNVVHVHGSAGQGADGPDDPDRSSWVGVAGSVRGGTLPAGDGGRLGQLPSGAGSSHGSRDRRRVLVSRVLRDGSDSRGVDSVGGGAS